MTKFDKSESWLRDKYRNKNMGPTEIANLGTCNVTPGSISQWVNKFDIQKRHRDNQWLQQKYVKENLTSTEIAGICGVCPQTVLNNLEKFNIDRPSNAEKWSVYDAPLEGVTGSDHPSYGITGEDHHNYDPDRIDQEWRKSGDWRWIRNRVRKRDNHTCQICGDEEKLHVHHIVPVGEGGRKLDPLNLMTLCGGCHRRVHSEYYGSNSIEVENSGWITQKTAAYQ